MHEHAYPSFAGSPPRRPKRSGRRREVSQLGYFSIIMTSFERHSTGRPLFTGRFVKGRTSCNRLVSLFDRVANSLLPPWRQRTGSSNRHRRRNFTGQTNLPARPFGLRRRRRCRRRSRHSMVAAQTGSSFPDGFPVSPTCFLDRCRTPEAGPIVRNIKHRSGKLLPVWCRHAGFSNKSSNRTSTVPNERYRNGTVVHNIELVIIGSS